MRHYPPPPPPPGPLPEYSSPPPPRNQKRVWIALAIVAAVLVALAIAVPLVLGGRGGQDEVVESTTTSSTAAPSTTAKPQKTTTTSEEMSSTTSSTVPVVPGLPGDSDGEWVEAQVPDVMALGVAAALSDEALVVQVQTESGPGIRAHLFATKETFELPVGDGDAGGIDVDGDTVVWWEGSYDETTFSYVEQHIYAYRLPDGPKIDIAGGETNVGYPQIAGSWLTWSEGRPWDEQPDEYWLVPVFGSLLDSESRPVGEPTSLVPSAVTYIIGDAGWTYSLSQDFLAWEQGADLDGFGAGTHVLDMGTLQTQPVGSGAWRPSLSGDILVFWDNGLTALDLTSGERWQIDAGGDFAAAAPTFAAYFRPNEGAAGRYEIAARGYGGAYEQVLAPQTAASPWLSAPIAVSSTRIAFPDGDSVRLFEWRAK